MNYFRGQIGYGFKELDEATGGLHQGELAVIASHPSVGKTSFALNVALHVARAGKKVIYFSLQHDKEYLEGCIARQSGIPMHEKEGYTNVRIETENGFSIDGIKEILQSEPHVDLVIIDYLQLLSYKKKNNRTLELAFISVELKRMAWKLEIPIICLVQLGVWWKHGEKPRLSDMEPIGALVQDCDTFLILQREPNGEKAECIIAEALCGQRNKTIQLKWYPSHLRFLSKESCLTEDGADFYHDIGKILLSDNPLDSDLRRILRVELMEKYNLTEIEAVNLLNGKNISDYLVKYRGE